MTVSHTRKKNHFQHNYCLPCTYRYKISYCMFCTHQEIASNCFGWTIFKNINMPSTIEHAEVSSNCNCYWSWSMVFGWCGNCFAELGGCFFQFGMIWKFLCIYPKKWKNEKPQSHPIYFRNHQVNFMIRSWLKLTDGFFPLNFECWEIKEANQNGIAPTVTCSLWMNSDTVRPVGVQPNPAGCLGVISFLSRSSSKC